MAEKKRNINKNRRKRSRVTYYVSGILGGGLILLHLALLYFAEPLLKNALQRFVHQESKGLYSLDFDDISIDLSSSSVELHELTIKLDTARFAALNKKTPIERSVYTIYLPEVYLKGINLYKVYAHGILHLSDVRFNKPEVTLLGDFLNSKIKLGDQMVYNELYPVLSEYLKAVKVDQIQLEDGFLGLYHDREDPAHQSKAEHISVRLDDFYLDAERYQNNQKIFYSENISVKLENYVLTLNDSLHIFKANQIEISSIDEKIVAKGVSLEPAFHLFDKDTLQSDLYEVWLSELKVEGADLYKAHFDKELEIDKMNFRHPFIKLINNERRDTINKEINYKVTTDLYRLIQGHLKKLKVNTFNVAGGAFHQVKPNDLNDPVYEIKELEITLDHFYLDSLAYLDTSKVLFADDIEVNLRGYNMQLPDSLHSLTADTLFISTKKSLIEAHSIRLQSFEGAEQIAEKKGKTLYNITVPKLLLKSIDMRKAYNFKILPIQKLEINDPDIKFSTYADIKVLNKGIKEKENYSNDLYALTSPFLQAVTVDTLSLKHGYFDLMNLSKEGKQAFANSRFAFKLFDFRLDSTARLEHNKIFFAENIDIHLYDYSIKLADDLHVLKAKNVDISTARAHVKVEGLSLKPLNTFDRKQLLKRYGKSALIEVSVPELIIDQVNLHEAYFNKHLTVTNIRVKEPEMKLVSYRDMKSRKFKMMPKEELYALIYPYLESIQIGNMELSDGDFDLVTEKAGSLNNLSRNDVSVSVSGFNMEAENLEEKDQLFDAEEVHVRFKDYVLNLPDSLHQLHAQFIDFHLTGPNVVARDVRLYPKNNVDAAHDMKHKWYLKVPEIRMMGVDLDKAFDERILEIDTFRIVTPEVKLLSRRDSIITIPSAKLQKTILEQKGIPKGLDLILVNHMVLDQGSMSFVNLLKQKEFTYSTAKLGVEFKNLQLSGQKDNSDFDFYADDIRLNLYDYFLRLPDSVHHFTADSLFISTDLSRIKLQNAHLYPANEKEALELLNKGKRSFFLNASIPFGEMTGVNFNKLYTSQRLFIDSLYLDAPFLKVYQAKPLTQRRKKKAWPNKSPKNMSPYLSSIDINKAAFGDGTFVLNKTFEEVREPLKIERVFGQVINFKLDTSAISPERFFFSDNIQVEARDYVYHLADSLYDIRAKRIGISIADKLLFADSLALQPRYYKYLFAQVVGHQVDRTDIKSKRVTLENTDIKSLLYNQNIKASKLNIDGMEARFFRDKRLPKKIGKYRAFPQEKLKNLPFVLDLDSVHLMNSLIGIEERADKSRESGELTFEQLDITVSPVTNDKARLERNATARIVGRGNLMGKGPLEARLTMPLDDPKNSFVFEGRLVEEMHLNAINPMLENVAFVSIRKGVAKKIDFKIEADEDSARGEMRFLYSNLRIGLIDRKSGKTKGIGESFKAFFANLFVIRSHNPNRAMQLRVGEIKLERDKTKSIYNFWWKSLFAGFKSTFGLDKEAYEELVEETE